MVYIDTRESMKLSMVSSKTVFSVFGNSFTYHALIRLLVDTVSHPSCYHRDSIVKSAEWDCSERNLSYLFLFRIVESLPEGRCRILSDKSFLCSMLTCSFCREEWIRIWCVVVSPSGFPLLRGCCFCALRTLLNLTYSLQ